jgi:ABC-type branched-subunit amino acid transport system ATPase component
MKFKTLSKLSMYNRIKVVADFVQEDMERDKILGLIGDNGGWGAKTFIHLRGKIIKHLRGKPAIR